MPTIVVGQVAVPDVNDAGTTEASAVEALDAVYLVAALLTAYSDTVPEGEVISQDPAPGTAVDPGTTVTLTISLGEELLAEGIMRARFRRRSRSRRKRTSSILQQRVQGFDV
jgi:hypothetical protein